MGAGGSLDEEVLVGETQQDLGVALDSRTVGDDVPSMDRQRSAASTLSEYGIRTPSA